MPAVTQYDFAKNSASFDRLDAGDLGVNLYKLYRRVSPMLPCDPASAAEPGFDPTLLTRASAVPTAIGATIPSNKRKFNGVSSQLDPNCDVPFRRFFARYMASNTVGGWKTAGFNSYLATDATTPGAAVDYAVIADNVLSFSIEVWPEGATNFSSVQAAFGPLSGQSVFDTWCGRLADPNWGVNADFASTNMAGVPKWRDAADANRVPMALNGPNGLPKRLLAVRITIRLYDLNTKSTWQATVIEYL